MKPTLAKLAGPPYATQDGTWKAHAVVDARPVLISFRQNPGNLHRGDSVGVELTSVMEWVAT